MQSGPNVKVDIAATEHALHACMEHKLCSVLMYLLLWGSGGWGRGGGGCLEFNTLTHSYKLICKKYFGPW